MPAVNDPAFKILGSQICATGDSSPLLSMTFEDLMVAHPDLVLAYPELVNWKSSMAIRGKFKLFWYRFKNIARGEIRRNTKARPEGARDSEERHQPTPPPTEYVDDDELEEWQQELQGLGKRSYREE